MLFRDTPMTTARGLLEARSRQLEQVIEQSGESIVVKDLDAVVTLWNREATTLYGFTAEEAIGRPLRELHAADLSETEYARVFTRIRAGKPTTSTVERRKKSGEIVRVLNNPRLHARWRTGLPSCSGNEWRPT
jgi:PAS domain S-box-containing protein